MVGTSLTVAGTQSFEDLKKMNDHGAEYWSARDLQPLLGYGQWRRFEDSIKRAVTSCKQSGNSPENHFAGAGKMVSIGSGTSRDVSDYHLSRFACYLIAQNGDPRKPEIANAQKYFAIQARRSGVQDKMFGVFHDAGYKGLYGGLGSEAIKARKGIAPKEQILDRMDTTELAANQFRMTQTRDKLARERVSNQHQAIRTHEAVGKEVRAAITRIGGTLPENIPPAEPIQSVEKRVKGTVPRLELAESDAKGLVGEEVKKK